MSAFKHSRRWYSPLGLIVEFLSLIVISEQLVYVRHPVIGVVEDAFEQVLD
jgi:hypothetical protein